MTLIVGLETDRGVYFGADSFWGAHYVDRIHQRKVIELDYATPDGKNWPLLVGLSGNPRVSQIIEHKTELEKDPREYKSGWAFLVDHVVDKIRSALKEGGALQGSDGEEDRASGFCLIGWRGELYFLGPRFQIAQSQRDYYSVGAGKFWADGSMATTEAFGAEELEMEPKTRLSLALQAATEHSSRVVEPYNFYFQEKPRNG